MKCRMWQNNLTVLQIHKTTSVKRVEKKTKYSTYFGNEESVKLKAKETVQKHCTLADNVIFHKSMG